jgi:exodeoxyribonuclease-3
MFKKDAKLLKCIISYEYKQADMVKIISWNVAGIRAVLRKNALDFALKGEYDIMCFQETKAEQSQLKNIEQFTRIYPHQYWNHSKTKKGYSGTAIWSKQPFTQTFESPVFDNEGRITSVEYNSFILVTVYTPNSKGDLSRLTERTTEWDPFFREYCNNLKIQHRKPIIICGDLNVIHQDIDIYQPEKHQGNIYAGYTMEERCSFTQLLSSGYIDAFRKFNTDPGNYTWWSYMHNARDKNIGWRLDYFLVDNEIEKNISNSTIENQIFGSDHCPITLSLNDLY